MDEKNNLSVPELLAAAQRKDADAMEKVALGYYTGLNGFELDGDKAFYWAKEFVSAHPKEAFAWELIGRCYFYGIGTCKSDQDAEENFSKAASLGRPSALYVLTERYFSDIDKNRRNRPIYLLHEATGATLAQSAFLLAQALLDGDEIAENQEKASYYHRRAVQFGCADLRALYYAGLAWFWGDGGPEDNVQARQCLEKVALADNAEVIVGSANYGNAAEIAGVMYYQGLGGPVDEVKGEQLLRRAINCNDRNIAAEAANDLGYRFYEEGIRLNEAIQLIRSAVAAGCSNAKVNLGLAYLEGKGVLQNTATAISYWEQAAKQGNETAIKNLKKMQSDAAPTVTPKQNKGRLSLCLKIFLALFILSILSGLISSLLGPF